MKIFEYYYDYTKEALDYIMASKILRNRDKKILQDLVDGKKTKEIAINNNCSYRTICTRRKEIFEKTKCFM
jgi:DNA-binding NarL/FixJ family response regulator